MNRVMKGNIYYANLDPVIGSEQGGTRPVIVVSNNICNSVSPTVSVAPLTSKYNNKNIIPTHIEINEVVKNESIILLEQIKTIDKCRIEDFIGRASKKIMKEVDRGIAITFGISIDEVTKKK